VTLAPKPNHPTCQEEEMASTILVHPIERLGKYSDMAFVFECEDPFQMSDERIWELITLAPTMEIRAYLFGLADMRRIYRATLPQHLIS
jgi:hypothetical protein